MGDADEKLDAQASGREVRMHDRETVELALAALGEGMTHAEAAELVGASERSVYRWAGGRLPRSCAGRPWGSGKMGGASGERKAARMSTGGGCTTRRRPGPSRGSSRPR